MSRAAIGAKLFPLSSKESAAGLTEADVTRYWPYGDARRYGAALDGVTDDTAAWQRMLGSGESHLRVVGGTLLIDPSAANELAASGVTLETVDATIEIASESGIGSAHYALLVSGSDNVVRCRFDMGGLGSGCIRVTGSRNEIHAEASNGSGSASSNGYESVVLVEGDDNIVAVVGRSLTAGAGPNGNVPRLLTIQGNANNTTVPLVRGRSVVAGLVTGACSGVGVDYVDLDTFEDNGLYILSASENVRVADGRIANGPEPIVLAGHDIEIGPVDILDCVAVIGLDGTPERVTLRGTRMRHSLAARACAFVGTRSGHTQTDTLRLIGCSAVINANNGGLAQFSVGAVNDFQVIGGVYEIHWNDNTSGSTRVVTHGTGDEVHYEGPVLILVDDKTVPLTAGALLQLDLPVVSEPSTYRDVTIVNKTAATVREGSVGAISQDGLAVRSSAVIANGGVYLLGSSAGVAQEVFGAGAPTAGYWGVGSRVRNSAPAAGEPEGWVCIAAGSPGTWVPFGLIQTANAYSLTNVTTRRTMDANTVTLAELADFVGTLVGDLQTGGAVKS